MKRIAVVAAALLAAPALADEDFGTVDSYNYGRLNLVTGDMQMTGGPRFGPNIMWDSSVPTGSFSNRVSTQKVLDWGDTNAGTVNGFQIGYATNSTVPVSVAIEFFTDDDGFNTAGRVPVPGGSFTINGLPGTSVPGQIQGFIFDIDLMGGLEFLLDGNDLDGDGRDDFSYRYHMANRGNATSMGPLVSTDGGAPPGSAGGPGMEDVFDRFTNNVYDGTFFFSGNPFAQFHMRLYNVPEPTSIALIVLGALATLRRR